MFIASGTTTSGLVIGVDSEPEHAVTAAATIGVFANIAPHLKGTPINVRTAYAAPGYTTRWHVWCGVTRTGGAVRVRSN
jgi:hypothetical protein